MELCTQQGGHHEKSDQIIYDYWHLNGVSFLSTGAAKPDVTDDLQPHFGKNFNIVATSFLYERDPAIAICGSYD